MISKINDRAEKLRPMVLTSRREGSEDLGEVLHKEMVMADAKYDSEVFFTPGVYDLIVSGWSVTYRGPCEICDIHENQPFTRLMLANGTVFITDNPVITRELVWFWPRPIYGKDRTMRVTVHPCVGACNHTIRAVLLEDE